jgi:hypothetical protein
MCAPWLWAVQSVDPLVLQSLEFLGEFWVELFESLDEPFDDFEESFDEFDESPDPLEESDELLDPDPDCPCPDPHTGPPWRNTSRMARAIAVPGDWNRAPLPIHRKHRSIDENA